MGLGLVGLGLKIRVRDRTVGRADLWNSGLESKQTNRQTNA